LKEGGHADQATNIIVDIERAIRLWRQLEADELEGNEYRKHAVAYLKKLYRHIEEPYPSFPDFSRPASNVKDKAPRRGAKRGAKSFNQQLPEMMLRVLPTPIARVPGMCGLQIF